MAARHPDGSSKLNIAAWIGPDDQRLTRRRLRGPGRPDGSTSIAPCGFTATRTWRAGKTVGGYAAAASSSCSGSAWVKPGCQRRKSSARSSLRTQVRTWSSRWAQLDGVELDRVFTDIVSGKSAARPQLQALLADVRDGDTVIVHSMDRLARNLDDLRRLVRELTRRGVAI